MKLEKVGNIVAFRETVLELLEVGFDKFSEDEQKLQAFVSREAEACVAPDQNDFSEEVRGWLSGEDVSKACREPKQMAQRLRGHTEKTGVEQLKMKLAELKEVAHGGWKGAKWQDGVKANTYQECLAAASSTLMTASFAGGLRTKMQVVQQECQPVSSKEAKSTQLLLLGSFHKAASQSSAEARGDMMCVCVCELVSVFLC